MKKKIVIASVLKPIDDVRSYWKLSQSMSKTNKYEVNIIGNTGKKQFADENIKLLPHSVDRRNWIKRILLRELILFKILRLKPDVLVVTTHELLNTALVCKIFIRCKVVYDVQENYSKNISQLNPSIFRSIVSRIILWKEVFSRLFINSYWLAEACYVDELTFLKNKYIILENKAIEYEQVTRDFNELRMLFSGTISEYGGIKRSISIFKKLKREDQVSTLKIIGQIHNPSLGRWLKEQSEKDPDIQLNLSFLPIPYDEILEAIKKSNLGIIGYEPSGINVHKIPTKLYEYSRYRLAYIVQEDTKWSTVGTELGGAIPVNFSSIDPENIHEKLSNADQLFPKSYPREATWEFESEQMLNSLNSLINKY